MAIDPNKKVGYGRGFSTEPPSPQKLQVGRGAAIPVKQPEIQRLQGGQATGGGASNTNNAGNTGIVAPAVNTNTVKPIAQETPVFKPVDFSKPSIAVSASPENQRVFQQAEKTKDNLGSAKGIEYSQDANGNILRKDMNSGSISPLQSRVSSMGPNGSTVSRELRPNEVAALENSKQMISDWKDYKINQQKEADRTNMMNAISRMPPATQASALQRLGIESMKDSTDRSQISANSENQRIGQELQTRQLELEARKNAFSINKDSAANNRENLKAESEIANRISSQQVAQADLFRKVMEDPATSPSQKLGIIKNSGIQSNPDTIRSVYGDVFKGVRTKTELRDAAKDVDISPEDYQLFYNSLPETL